MLQIVNSLFDIVKECENIGYLNDTLMFFDVGIYSDKKYKWLRKVKDLYVNL